MKANIQRQVETINPGRLEPGIQVDGSTSLDASHSILVAVLDQANRISALNDPRELLERTTELMMEVAGSKVGVLYLLDEEAGELVIQVVKGCQENSRLVGLRINCRIGATGTVIQENRVLMSPDLKNDRLWYPELVCSNQSPLVSAITLPLMLRGQPLGAIQLFNYYEANVEILRLLADRLAIDFEKLDLFENAQRRNNLLIHLTEAMQRLYMTLDREQLLELATKETSQLLQVDKSSIFLTNAATGNLEFQISFLQESREASLIPQYHGQDQHKPAAKLACADGTSLKPSKSTSKHGQQFGFVTRTAITVPLLERLKSSAPDQPGEHERIIGGLTVLNKNSGAFTSDDAQVLQIIANQVSYLLRITSLYEESNQLYIDTIKALVTAVDAKDAYTQGHSSRVSDLSVAIAMEMGLGDKDLHDVLIGGLIHDIGKIGIPDSILNKSGKLTELEFEVMKKHPLIGQRIIGDINTLQGAQSAIIDHHERLDGSGYPFGIQGDQISMIGRIIAVADVYDAMTSCRPYRDALDEEDVRSYLEKNAGILFEPACVHALIRALDKEN